MRLAGYAALFDVRDRGGDIVRKGAFAGAAVPIPLLWQHDPARRIGTVTALSEDERGLYVEAVIQPRGGCARAAAAMLGEGAVGGLSFGYRVRDGREGPPGPGGIRTRELRALDIVEVSIVARPMQPGARVEQVSEE